VFVTLNNGVTSCERDGMTLPHLGKHFPDAAKGNKMAVAAKTYNRKEFVRFTDPAVLKLILITEMMIQFVGEPSWPKFRF
jgi:hypothetical protein